MATASRRYRVELADKSYLIDLFLLSEDAATNLERFSRRRKVSFLNRDVFLPTVEDAIITKLRWFLAGQKHKDFQDAIGMVAVQGERIDWDYVTSWCDRHGTQGTRIGCGNPGDRNSTLYRSSFRAMYLGRADLTHLTAGRSS